MTVYLYCEGVQDYAVLVSLIRKVANNNAIDVQWKKRHELRRITTLRKTGFAMTGSYKILAALATLANRDKCKHIAYHRDSDKENYQCLYNTINEAMEQFRKAGLQCIAIIPKPMIESWILSDGNAYPTIPTNPSLPLEPEQLHGDETNPDSNHPKNYLNRVLAQFQLERNRNVYAEIAENSNVDTIRKKCPVSFDQHFYTDMQTFIPKAACI
jgi:hypothetical protein